MKISTALAAGATVVLAGTALGVSPASASHGGGTAVRASGSCSGTTHWKLKAKPDNGRIEVEGEIDSNHAGQSWHWRIKHDGSVSAQGTGTTKAPSGSFSVNRRLVNLRGNDTIVLRATNTGNGETCRGSVTL